MILALFLVKFLFFIITLAIFKFGEKFDPLIKRLLYAFDIKSFRVFSCVPWADLKNTKLMQEEICKF